MASNLETAKKGYELFQRGDVPTLSRTSLMITAPGYRPARRTNCLGPVALKVSEKLEISSAK